MKISQPFSVPLGSVVDASVAAAAAIDPAKLSSVGNPFTPTVYGLTTAGVGTYVWQEGTEIRFGDWVFVRFSLFWSAHTGSGSIRMAGLRTPARVGSQGVYGFYPAYGMGTLQDIRGYVSPGTSEVKIVDGNLAPVALTANGQLDMTGFYPI